MFKNLDNDIDTKDGHMQSGRSFRKVPLVNLFEKSYRPVAQDEDFYSGEEEGRSYGEYLEFSRTEEVETRKLHQEEPETLGTAPTVKVSIITPPVVLELISNQSNRSNRSNQSNQSNQSMVTSSLVHIRSRNQRRYMEDEMRLPSFRGDGS
jgi:hypothetical protein